VRRDDPADTAAADQSESAKQQQRAPTAIATAATAATATDKQLTYEEFCALVQHRAHTVRGSIMLLRRLDHVHMILCTQKVPL
jgi:hypothetical protein